MMISLWIFGDEGTLKSSIFIGFSSINHPAFGDASMIRPIWYHDLEDTQVLRCLVVFVAWDAAEHVKLCHGPRFVFGVNVKVQSISPSQLVMKHMSMTASDLWKSSWDTKVNTFIIRTRSIYPYFEGSLYGQNMPKVSLEAFQHADSHFFVGDALLVRAPETGKSVARRLFDCSGRHFWLIF